MDTKEHAQLILAHMLAGWVASGRALTLPDQMGLIDQAWMQAEAFTASAFKREVKIDM